MAKKVTKEQMEAQLDKLLSGTEWGEYKAIKKTTGHTDGFEHGGHVKGGFVRNVLVTDDLYGWLEQNPDMAHGILSRRHLFMLPPPTRRRRQLGTCSYCGKPTGERTTVCSVCAYDVVGKWRLHQYVDNPPRTAESDSSMRQQFKEWMDGRVSDDAYKRMETRRGPRMVAEIRPTKEFWEWYGQNRQAAKEIMADLGYSLGKSKSNPDAWQLNHWKEVPKQSSPKADVKFKPGKGMAKSKVPDSPAKGRSRGGGRAKADRKGGKKTVVNIKV